MKRAFPFSLLSASIFIAACIYLTNAGIIRHDVAKEKYIALAREPQFDCAGRMYYNGGPGASCVLVSDRFVLTAAHVVAKSTCSITDTTVINDEIKITQIPGIPYFAEASSIEVEFRGERYRCKRIIPHPQYILYSRDRDFDLALIELATAVRDVKPAALNASFDESGRVAVGVGYGTFEIADSSKSIVDPGIKIAGENTIDSIGVVKSELEGKAIYLFADFDHPDSLQKYNRMGSATPLPLEYMPNSGDSGSGLFINENGHWKLIGICSSVMRIITNTHERISHYGSIGFWTRLSVFNDWIEKIIRMK